MGRLLFFAFAVASLTGCAVQTTEPADNAANNICCGGACCLIDGVCYADGDVNPADACLFCDRDGSGGGMARDWTPVDSPECSGEDMGPDDAGPEDMGPEDMGEADAGPEDMGEADAGPEDMGEMPMDMDAPDTGTTVDAGGDDMGGTTSDSGGCSAAGAAGLAPYAALLLLARRRRRAA